MVSVYIRMVRGRAPQGIEHLNWRNHSIASFIKKCTSFIADASALLALLHTNAGRAVAIIRGWSMSALHAPRKKTAQAEDYVQWYRGSVEARLAAIRDEAATVHALISDIYLALQARAGPDPPPPALPSAASVV
jgi:hypothetical protein